MTMHSLRAAVLVSFAAAITFTPQNSAQSRPSASDASSLSESRILISQHHPERAEALLQPLLSLEPENVLALVLLAESRLQQNDRAGAKALLTRALSASPNSPEANNALGSLFIEDHLYPEAMDRFETILAIFPKDPEARKGELSAATQLALSARQANNPDAALQALQHALVSLPDDPQLLLGAGIEATELHNIPYAYNALNTARKLAPCNPEILYALGQLELDQQHMPSAEADLRAYLALRPDDATAHYGLGHVLAMLQRTSEARTEFERSIQLQPIQTEAYYQIGQIELDAHHDDKAESLFRRVLARDPTHGGALTGMGIIAFRAKDYATAERQLAAAQKTSPDYGPAHYYRGLALARLGRKQEADAELLRATELAKQASGISSAADTP